MAIVAATLAAKLPIFPAALAAPPKIICVMLGMKSMLMMKAIMTIVQGMRFASHISIE